MVVSLLIAFCERIDNMIRITCNKGNNTYLLSSSSVRSEDHGAVTAYSIAIIDCEGHMVIEYIPEDFRTVHELFDMITEEELYPEHLSEFVKDCLCSRYQKVIPISRYLGSPSIA